MGGFSETVQEHVHKMKTEILGPAEHIEQTRDLDLENPAFQDGSGHMFIHGRGHLRAITSFASELEELCARGIISGLYIDFARREIRLALSNVGSGEPVSETIGLARKAGLKLDIEPVQPDRIFTKIKAALDPYEVFPSFEFMRPRPLNETFAVEPEREVI
jgi:hypothetical protein